MMTNGDRAGFSDADLCGRAWVLPAFYQSRERFIEMMRQTIALNGSFFSAQRMLWQYLHNAYRIGGSEG